MRIAKAIVLTLTLTMLGAGVAGAQSYVATLDGGQEVPPSTSGSTGSATLTLNGAKMLSFNISYTRLVGTESAAHIHGPAAAGVNAGIVFALPAGSPKVGTVGPLSPAQEADLNAGLLYINVHSSTFPGGEIRGQILSGGVPVEDSSWGRVKQLYRQ